MHEFLRTRYSATESNKFGTMGRQPGPLIFLVNKFCKSLFNKKYFWYHFKDSAKKSNLYFC